MARVAPEIADDVEALRRDLSAFLGRDVSADEVMREAVRFYRAVKALMDGEPEEEKR